MKPNFHCRDYEAPRNQGLPFRNLWVEEAHLPDKHQKKIIDPPSARDPMLSVSTPISRLIRRLLLVLTYG